MRTYFLSLFGIAVAVFAAGLFVLTPVQIAFGACLFLSLSWASYVDLKQMEIPDTVSIGLFPAGAVWVLIQAPDDLPVRLMSAMAVLVGLYLFGRAFAWLRGQDGLGFGDVKLIASSTVWIGISNLSVMIVLAACSGIIVSIISVRNAGEAGLQEKMPFGPHLAFSIWIVWLWTTHTSVTA